MGGAVGHLYHLYDNPDLTFGEIKDIIQAAASGKLEQVSEKLDGLNLVFTWDESGSGLRVARNAGDIKSGGMDAAGLAAKFADRGNLSDAFNSAFKVLNQALGSLPPDARAKVFGPDGRIWYSMELIYSANPNVIQYDSNNIVFHGWPVFKALPDGTVEKGPGGGVGYLSKYIEHMQKNVKEKDWQVRGPALVALKKMSSAAIPKKALTAINRAMAQARVGDDDTIQDYLFNYVLADAKAAKMPPNALQDIAARVAGIPGAPNLTQIKGKIDKALVPIVQEYVKVGPKTIKSAIAPIEAAIHDFAVEALRGLSSTLISNSPGEVNRLQGEVQKAISAIQSSGNEQAMAILKAQMAKLGNIKNLATPMEGVVFIHNGNAYKFTGAFAPVNQILGLFKYGRGKTKLAAEGLEMMFEMILESILNEKTQADFNQRIKVAQDAVQKAKEDLTNFLAAKKIFLSYKDALTKAGISSKPSKAGSPTRKKVDDQKAALAAELGWDQKTALVAGQEQHFSSREAQLRTKVKKAEEELAYLDPMTAAEDLADPDSEEDDTPSSPPPKAVFPPGRNDFPKDIKLFPKNEWIDWPGNEEEMFKKSGFRSGFSKAGKTGKEAPGVGPGEEWLKYIFAAKISGGKKSYDLTMYDGSTWEVKGLSKKNDAIRPGVGGRLALDRANEKLRTVLQQALNFFKDWDSSLLSKSLESSQSAEGKENMQRKIDRAHKTISTLAVRLSRGEIPPDWISVHLRNALSYLKEFKEKFASNLSEPVRLMLGDKEVRVPRQKAIELSREYDPDSLQNFDGFERVASHLKDEAFVDPAKFILDWFDSVDIDSIFSKVTGGLILVTPSQYLVMPKSDMKKHLEFASISGGVPKIYLKGVTPTDEAD